MERNGLLAKDNHAAGRDLIGQAALIAEGEGKLPRGFISALFSRAAVEDLANYSPQELAVLAVASYEHLGQRAPETARIRIANPGPVLGTKSLERDRKSVV
jgi:hypothetical protein